MKYVQWDIIEVKKYNRRFKKVIRSTIFILTLVSKLMIYQSSGICIDFINQGSYKWLIITSI